MTMTATAIKVSNDGRQMQQQWMATTMAAIIADEGNNQDGQRCQQ